jgi:hypothetical protein
MQLFITEGRAWRDGEIIADDVELIECGGIRSTPINVAGSARQSVRPTPFRGPTTIRFRSILDPVFRSELERLAEAR